MSDSDTVLNSMRKAHDPNGHGHVRFSLELPSKFRRHELVQQSLRMDRFGDVYLGAPNREDKFEPPNPYEYMVKA